MLDKKLTLNLIFDFFNRTSCHNMPPAKANHIMLHYNISQFNKKTGSKLRAIETKIGYGITNKPIEA
ncbi:hypothetical protein CMK19_18745 [Candidatus Poribacteria bacterium]|nr:hypothetical protein [Candidatus Poribacteria bacterium]